MGEGTYGFNQGEVQHARESLQDLQKQFAAVVSFMTEISDGTTNKWNAEAQVVFRSQLSRLEEHSAALSNCTAAINNWLDATEASYVQADNNITEAASNLIV